MIDHLWQSTLFAGAAALLAWSLRRNHAHVRYAVWLAASLKFLVPFAALVAVGRRFGLAPLGDDLPLRVDVRMNAVVDGVTRPFSLPVLDLASSPASRGVDMPVVVPYVLVCLWAVGTIAVLAVWLIRWRQVAAIVRSASPVREPRVIEALARLETDRERPRLEVVFAETRLEPGVFGFLRPVLMWPRGIEARLSDDQIEAILAHELCHVTRRDNLAAAAHAVVQALFWFNPTVWYIGRRLVDERERACDETVLQSGSKPEVYAESILRTCQHVLEAPPLCVAGVSGSDLKQRMEHIMKHGTARGLTGWRKALLTGTAVAAIIGPISAGVLQGPVVEAQATPPVQDGPQPSFEVASVKPNTTGDNQIRIGAPGPDRMTVTNAPLREIVRIAYQVQQFQLTGGPDWINSERFDINAKLPESSEPPSAERRFMMLRSLLAERFKLAVHTETREMPIYELVLARSDGRLGEKLRVSGPDCAPVSVPAGMKPPPPPPAAGNRNAIAPGCPTMIGPGFITTRRTTMAQLSRALGNVVRRTVVDKTGLTGFYDADVEYSPEFRPLPPPGFPPPPDTPSDGPSVYTALQEQLGLKMDSARGPVEMIVIDSVEALIPD